MSTRKTVVFTTSVIDRPAAARTAPRLSRTRAVWVAISPSTSAPVAGSRWIWPEQKSSSPAAIAWLYGPTAAGAALVAMAVRSMDWSFLGLGVRRRRADDGGRRDEWRAVTWREQRSGVDRGADDALRRLGVGQRRIEDPQGRPRARQPDRPAGQPGEGPPEWHERRLEAGAGRQQVVGRGQDSGPVMKRPGRQPALELAGQVVRGEAGCAVDRRAARDVGGEDRRGGQPDPGHDQQDPGRLAPDRPGQGGHPLAATLDQGDAGGQEEGHVRTQPGGRPLALLGAQDRIAAGASLLPPASPAAIGIRFSSRAARAGVGRAPPTARRAASIARRTRLSAVGPRASRSRPGPETWRVSSGPAAAASDSRSARASGAMIEWRAWKPSGRRPMIARVRFSLAGASRTTGARRLAGSLMIELPSGRARRCRSDRASRAGAATPPRPASAGAGRARSRLRPGPP